MVRTKRRYLLIMTERRADPTDLSRVLKQYLQQYGGLYLRGINESLGVQELQGNAYVIRLLAHSFEDVRNKVLQPFLNALADAYAWAACVHVSGSVVQLQKLIVKAGGLSALLE